LDQAEKNDVRSNARRSDADNRDQAERRGSSIEQVFVARPTGFNRADAIHIRVPIEGADIGLVAEGA
jgi:hypothetical protein